MADAHILSGLLMTADWAEVVQGKLYIQGGGWSNVMANVPAQIAFCGLITVPFDQTNIKHRAFVKLVTGDGAPYPGESPAEVTIEFEVGRPPGMKPGQDTQVPIAAKINGMSIEPGRYRFDLTVCVVKSDGSETEPGHLADVTFTALAAGG